MKRSVLFSFILLFILSAELHGQVVTDTARFSESIWSMKKKKMVLEHMNLTEAEKASFWPLYENYNQAIRYIEMESLEIIDSYHRVGKGMTRHELEKYTKRILQNDFLLAKVRKQYYKRFSKALSPDLASQFLQFDDTLRMMVRFEVKANAQNAAATHASLR